MTGFGYFSGRDIRVEFRPAPAGAGVTFVRGDLQPGGSHAGLARAAARRAAAHDARAGAACASRWSSTCWPRWPACEIDNCEVWVERGRRCPAATARRSAFVEALDAVGTVEQAAPVRQIRVTRRIRVGDEQTVGSKRRRRAGGRLVDRVRSRLQRRIRRSAGRRFGSTCIRRPFRTELAPCRTFLEEEAARAMVAQGVGTRVTPQNLLIFGPHGPIDNTLRFENECVRHKVLDVVGDLALTGCEVVADVVAYRSGHRLHAELARQLMEQAGITCADEHVQRTTTVRIALADATESTTIIPSKSGGKREHSTMTTRIAQHASVDPRAEIDDDVEIGPFSTIGPHVRIRAGTRLMNTVTITGPRHDRPRQRDLSERRDRRRAAGHQLRRQRHAGRHRRRQHRSAKA